MLAIGGLSACAHRAPVSDTALEKVSIEREDRDAPWPPGRSCFVIDNTFGDVHLRAGRTGRLAWHAVMQRIDPSLPRPSFDLGAAGQCVRVAVEIAGALGDSRHAWDTRRARVDLALAVPPGVHIAVAAPAGSIDAKAIDNDIEASTREGAVALSGSGDYDIVTRTGAIVLTARGERSDRRWHARSAEGAIRVHLDGVPAGLTASTCGRIRSDVAGGAARVGDDGCATLRIGAADPAAIVLDSDRGDIELFRLEP